MHRVYAYTQECINVQDKMSKPTSREMTAKLCQILMVLPEKTNLFFS